LLDAQRTRLTVRISATDSDTRLMLATVDLFKALGGGWQAFEPAAATSASAALAPNSGTPAFSIEETQ
jgi:outer membrane protein, multidrug efflux system